MGSVQEDRVIELVKRLLDTLEKDQQGLDDQHASKRYARFLRNLLKPHIEEVEARRRAEAVLASEHNSSSHQLEPPCDIPLHDPNTVFDPRMAPLAHADPGTGMSHSQAIYSGYEHHYQTNYSHSIWDDTLPSSEDTLVPMPPILGYPDPNFLASMFPYAEHVDPTNFFN